MLMPRLALACALFALHVPPAFSQQVPILPAPGSIPELARTVPIDSSRKQSLRVTSTAENPAAVNSRVLSAGEPRALQVIDIDPNLLRAPVAGAARTGQFSIGGDRRPTTAVPLTFTLDGRVLELAMVAETHDQTSIDRYVTAQVLNAPGAYARFSVAADRVLGTIVMPDAAYRLLPAGSGQVSVHRLTSEGAASTSKFRRIVSPGSSDAAMERRHVQLERLAQIQPTRAFANESGRYFKAEGGNLGALAGVPSAQSVASVIKSLAEVNYAPELLELRIRNVRKLARGSLIVFRQTIRKIPVYGSNQLTVDASGNVVEVTTQFVDPSLASDLPVMSEVEARKAALREVESETKAPVAEYELLAAPQLQYEREGAGGKLVPYYTFALRPLPDGKPIAVHVNAHSGRATVVMNPQAYGWRVCSRHAADPGPANPATCSDSAAMTPPASHMSVPFPLISPAA